MMLEDIVDVFARDSVRAGALRTSDSFVGLRQRYGDSLHFDAQCSKVEEAKEALEAQMDQAGTTGQVQVRLALKGVVRRRGREQDESRHIFIELVRGAYRPSWNQQQQDYFDNWSQYLAQSRDYFLSFSNRNLAPDTPLRVNESHEFLIRKLVPKRMCKHHWTSKNLLAEALHRWLAQNSATGYYFSDHGGFSEEVVKDLASNCNRALVFIQLFEEAMFVRSPSYCHTEFEFATSGPHVKPVILLNLDGDRLEGNMFADTRVHPDFDTWYAYLNTHGYFWLKPTAGKRKVGTIRYNLDKLTEKVLHPIKDGALESIFMLIPAD